MGKKDSAKKPAKKASKQALWKAVMNGNAESAAQAIDGGAPVDSTDARGFTPLAEAVVSKNAALAEALLTRGADPNVVLPHGDDAWGILPETPLLEVLRYGSQALTMEDESDVTAREREHPELFACFARHGVELPDPVELTSVALIGEWSLFAVLCPFHGSEESPRLLGADELDDFDQLGARLRFDPDGSYEDATGQLPGLSEGQWDLKDGKLRGDHELALYHGGRVLAACGAEDCTFYFRKWSGDALEDRAETTASEADVERHEARAEEPAHQAGADILALVRLMLDESVPREDREAAIREFDVFGKHKDWRPETSPEVLDALLTLAGAPEPIFYVESALARAAKSSTAAVRALLAKTWHPGAQFSEVSDVARRFASGLSSAMAAGCPADSALQADVLQWIRDVLDAQIKERDFDFRWDTMLSDASLAALQLARRSDQDKSLRQGLLQLAPSLARWVCEQDLRGFTEVKWQLQALALLGPLEPTVRDIVLQAALSAPPPPPRGRHRVEPTGHEQGLAIAAALQAVRPEELPVRELTDRIVALATTEYESNDEQGMALNALEDHVHHLPSPTECQRALAAIATHHDRVSRAVDVAIEAQLDGDFLLPAVEELWKKKSLKEDALWCWRDLAQHGSQAARARLLEVCSSRSKALREQAKELYKQLD